MNFVKRNLFESPREPALLYPSHESSHKTETDQLCWFKQAEVINNKINKARDRKEWCAYESTLRDLHSALDGHSLTKKKKRINKIVIYLLCWYKIRKIMFYFIYIAWLLMVISVSSGHWNTKTTWHNASMLIFIL